MNDWKEERSLTSLRTEKSGMNWKQFWQQQANVNDPLLQVGRKGGLSRQDDFLETYAAYVAQQLQLTKDDIVLDVCCGNGMLTHYLATYCKAIVGVDFSQPHIDYAQQHFAATNIQFTCLDALQLGSETFSGETGFTKSTLCFSFQYFESVQAGLKVIEGVFKHTRGPLFIGDIPNRDRFFVYYHSPVELARLVKQMLFNRNDMGKFWSEYELDFIAKKIGGKGRKISQPDHFPYAHYRMDYLISR